MISPRKNVKRREPVTPREPQTPSKHHRGEPITPPATPSRYSTAKDLFQRGSRSRTFVGRKNEETEIKQFIQSKIAKNTSGSLYVSGVPGTGKSALVHKVFEKVAGLKKKISINCMSIDKPDQVYLSILQAFDYTHKSLSKLQAISLLETHLKSTTQHLLVLDEIDHIMQGDQEVIFRLFEWSCNPQSKLILIGIANSLDLTDRFLPRLQMHKLVPQVLAVKPYSQDELIEIIQAQLATLGGDQLFDPKVINLFAAKIAAQSGDLRRTFDLCARAVQLVEEEWMASDMPPTNELPVTMKHAVRVCQEAFGGQSTISRIKQMNYIQLCTLVVACIEDAKASRQIPKKSVRVVDLWQTYQYFCTSEPSWQSLDLQDFIQVLNALESFSLLTISGICGMRGIGAQKMRVSHGGHSSGVVSDGNRSSYSQRRVLVSIQTMDMVTATTHDSLRKLLLDQL